jgi:hypothetical protein
MKTALCRTRCECQATLTAEVDENRVVLRGAARDPRRHRFLPAPANTVLSQGSDTKFSIGWLCPWCTRNTLRSFDVTALRFRETDSSDSTAPTVA